MVITLADYFFMRKQYYFRPFQNRFYAWDVDRLIKLTKDSEVKQISLDSIKEIDENHWFNNDETPTCRAIFEHAKLIQEADLNYPIILAEDGRVMDGMHRVGKALIQGQDIIDAVQFRADPEPDFRDVYPDELQY